MRCSAYRAIVLLTVGWGLLFTNAQAQQALEVLTFWVPQAHQARFAWVDDSVWTRALARQPGFLHKQLWRHPHHPDTLLLHITWRTFAHWLRVPAGKLAHTDSLFRAALGAIPFQLIRSQGYEAVPISTRARRLRAQRPARPAR